MTRGYVVGKPLSTASGSRSVLLVALSARILHLSRSIDGHYARVKLLCDYRSGIDGIGVDAPSRPSVGLCINSSTAASIAVAVVAPGSVTAVPTALRYVVSLVVLAAAADVSTLTFMASTVSTSVALSGLLAVATATVRGPGHGPNSVCALCF